MDEVIFLYAVKNKNFNFMNYFIRAGTDIHIKDNAGVSLKDMLDSSKDKFLYLYLVDEELDEESATRGR